MPYHNACLGSCLHVFLPDDSCFDRKDRLLMHAFVVTIQRVSELARGIVNNQEWTTEDIYVFVNRTSVYTY